MKVVVELSGGADSALAAIYAIRKYMTADFYALFIDYGQKYAEQERKASVEIANHLNCFYGGWNWEEVKISKFWQQGDKVVEYIPLRNLFLSSIALSYAQSVGAEVLINGSKSLAVDSTDPYSFRDSTKLFYQHLELTELTGTEDHIPLVRIEPLLAMNRTVKMTKREVYKELEDLAMPETWSCFHPSEDGKECGSCKNCKEKAEYVNTTV